MKLIKQNLIVHILKVLCKFSSNNASIPQTAIAKYLNDLEIPCDRKTVGRNIKYLQDFGIDIQKDEKGYFVDKEQVFKIYAGWINK